MFEKFRLAFNVASHLPRYRKIVQVLIKYGFAETLKLALLENYLGVSLAKKSSVSQEEILARSLPERVRLALEELGPTFIKLGQIVSSRRDLIEDAYYQELVKLQAAVPPFPLEEVYRQVERSLGKSVQELFASFEEVARGSGSIAQVHRATLHDGRVVAVKVQRPEILPKIEQDVAILSDLALFLEDHVPNLASLNPKKMVTMFSQTLLEELDFTREAKNIFRFATQFEGNESIVIPKVVEEFSCREVLVIDFLEGYPIDDRELLLQKGLFPSEIAQKMTTLILEQIFHAGFFHADPHPGNVVVLPAGQIGLYDYGMMGVFTPEFRMSLAKMMLGIATKNHRQVMDALLEMSEGSFAGEPSTLLSEVEELVEENLGESLKQIQLEVVLNKLLGLLRKHHLKMRGDFYLGIKALTQVEAIGRQLDPEINFVKLARPYAMELIQEHYHPRRLAKVLLQLLGEGVDFLDEFPQDLRFFYHQVKDGKLQIPLKHCISPEGIEPLRKTLDSVFNRLVNALLASALLIASALLVHANIPPKLFGVPILGLIGFSLGFALSLRLAFSIWKHGGL